MLDFASHRPMPSALQDGSIQRVACDAVQGSDEGILEVLSGFWRSYVMYILH